MGTLWRTQSCYLTNYYKWCRDWHDNCQMVSILRGEGAVSSGSDETMQERVERYCGVIRQLRAEKKDLEAGISAAVKKMHAVCGANLELEARIEKCAGRLDEIVESGDERVDILQAIELEAGILRGEGE